MSLKKIDPNVFKKPAPPVPWIIEGVAAEGALTLLAGVGGLGKSSLGLGFGSAAARGDHDYAGFRVRQQVPMIYVDAENGEGEMHRRAHAFDIYDGFYDFDGDLAEHGASLHEQMRERKALVILDSFRALFPHVEEDKSRDVLPALKALQVLARETGCGILLLHHTTKGGEIFRGSGEFQNRPEITITMRRDNRGNRLLNWEKCRMGVEPPTTYLRLVDEAGKLNWLRGPDIPPGIPGKDLGI